MKNKVFKYIKVFISVALILSLVAPSYASLSASDGSAFVTKAEFDSALADFNSRLTTFEAGINSKIDSQVTSYLDRNGIWNGKDQLNLSPNDKLLYLWLAGRNGDSSGSFVKVNGTTEKTSFNSSAFEYGGHTYTPDGYVPLSIYGSTFSPGKETILADASKVIIPSINKSGLMRVDTRWDAPVQFSNNEDDRYYLQVIPTSQNLKNNKAAKSSQLTNTSDNQNNWLSYSGRRCDDMAMSMCGVRYVLEVYKEVDGAHVSLLTKNVGTPFQFFLKPYSGEIQYLFTLLMSIQFGSGADYFFVEKGDKLFARQFFSVTPGSSGCASTWQTGQDHIALSTRGACFWVFNQAIVY